MEDSLETIEKNLIEKIYRTVSFSIQKIEKNGDFFDFDDINLISEVISVIVEATSKIAKKNFQLNQDIYQLIKNSNLKIFGVLRIIKISCEKHEDIFLNDLIKHELKDILTEWKISILPQIEKQLSTSIKKLDNSSSHYTYSLELK